MYNFQENSKIDNFCENYKDHNFRENSKNFCINQVEFYIHLYEVSEQQANEWLGNNWREQFNNFSNWREMHRQMDKYIKIDKAHQ